MVPDEEGDREDRQGDDEFFLEKNLVAERIALDVGELL